jgi:hypothetical protein
MADFTADDGAHSEDLATQIGSRTVHSTQFLYTSSGGALDIVTPTITPDRQAIRVDWMEIDISASSASYNHTITMEFPAGHEYEHHQYLVAPTFAGASINLEQRLYEGTGGVVVPNGAILRLVATNSTASATFKIHMLYEII